MSEALCNSTTPRDCTEADVHTSGVYTICPDGANMSYSVYCEVDGDDVWTFIQQRVDGSVLFNRTWDQYR